MPRVCRNIHIYEAAEAGLGGLCSTNILWAYASYYFILQATMLLHFGLGHINMLQ